MPGAIPQSRLVTRPVPISDRSPEPTFLQGAKASFWSAAYADDQDMLIGRAVDDGYVDVVDELHRRGFGGRFKKANSFGAPVEHYDEAAIWQAIATARQRDGKAFANLPDTADAFRAVLTAPIRGDIASTADVAQRAGIGGQLAGGFAYGATDPVNTATMVVGVGQTKTIAQTILREAVLNARIEAVQQPVRMIERGLRGKETTTGEMLTDIGMAAGGAALLGGAAKGLELHAAPLAQAVGGRIADARETTIAGVWDRLPAAVRQRWGSAAKITDDDLPDIAEAAIGAGNLSADEKAAMAVLMRERQIERSNPFVPNGAGIDAHRERLDAAINDVLRNVPPPVKPVLDGLPRSSRPRLAEGTALGSGVVGDGAQAALRQKIAVVESGNGRAYANPNSTARGKYQFLEGTWLNYFKRRFGSAGLSDTQILDRRRDPGVQDVLMSDMTADNAAFLRRRGEDETAGNLYLVHFAGQGGARRLFDAGPAARAGDVLGAKVVRANPWMRDMTVGDVVRWAHRKMDEAPPARGVGAGLDAGRIDGEAEYRGGLREEIDRLQGDNDRIAEARAPAGEDAADAEAVLVESADALPEPLPVEAPADPAASPDAVALLPRLQEVIDDRARSINRLDAIARDLGVPEADIRRGLIELATTGALRMKRNGQFARLPRDMGPIDALKFVGRMGGVRDDEGHALVSSRNLQRLVPGAGPLIRKSGMSIDGIGEHLHDAGYFGPPSAVERPDENTVLQFLERIANGERVYPHGQEVAPPARAEIDAEEAARYEAMADSYRAAGDDLDFNVDDALIEQAIRRYGDLDQREGLLRALEDAFDDAQQDVRFERDEGYAGYDDDTTFRDTADAGAEMGAGRRPDSGNAGEGRAAGAVADEGAFPAVDAASARAFDDPDAAAAVAQVDSLDHDLRAMIDPAIAERQRQEAVLRAAAPMRAAADQDSTIGAPLFDAADQTRLQLDADASPVTLRELLASLDDEEAAIKAVRNCL